MNLHRSFLILAVFAPGMTGVLRTETPISPVKSQFRIPVDDHGTVVIVGGMRSGRRAGVDRTWLNLRVEGKRGGAITEIEGAISLKGAAVDGDESEIQGFDGDNRQGIRVNKAGDTVVFRAKNTQRNSAQLSLRLPRDRDPTITLKLKTRRGGGAATYQITKDGMVEIGPSRKKR